MTDAWWANPTMAAAQLAIDILPFLPMPVAGGLGLLLFFAAIPVTLAGVMRLMGVRF